MSRKSVNVRRYGAMLIALLTIITIVLVMIRFRSFRNSTELRPTVILDTAFQDIQEGTEEMSKTSGEAAVLTAPLLGERFDENCTADICKMNFQPVPWNNCTASECVR